MTSSLIGQMLGKYRIETFIGEGGFAAVYRAHDTEFDRSVAVKIFDPHKSRDPRFVARARQEAEASFSLRHPNIVATYDFQMSDNLYFMVMEYVDGPTLRSVLIRQGAMDLVRAHDEVTRLHDVGIEDITVMRQHSSAFHPLELGVVTQIAIDLCAGLGYAHARGVIHRDVKPDNVLISPRGSAQLGDFGIARIQEESHLTRTGIRIGTMAYMSPEQILGQRDIDARSDIYSVGVVLFELLTGVVPFAQPEYQALREVPPPPSALREGIPDTWDEVVLRCLERNKAARYAHVEDVAQVVTSTTHPTPLSGLLIADATTMRAEPVARADQASNVACTGCGFQFEVGSFTECPGCLQPISPNDEGMVGLSFETDAQQLVAELGLQAGLPMDVRDYEFKRTVEPTLTQHYDTVLTDWKAILAGGSIVIPTSDPVSRPQSDQILAVSKALQRLAAIWESPAVGEYIVSIESRRRRRAHSAELKGRAYYMLGLYHSLLGANAQKHDAMLASYIEAKARYQWTDQALASTHPEVAAAARLAGGLAGMVVDYAHESSVPPELISLAQAAQSWHEVMPAIRSDLESLHDYESAVEPVRMLTLQHEAIIQLQNAQRVLEDHQMHTQALLEEERDLSARTVQQQSRIENAYHQDIVNLPTRRRQVTIAAWLAPWLIALAGSGLIMLIIEDMTLSVAYLYTLGTLGLAFSAGFAVKFYKDPRDTTSLRITAITLLVEYWALIAAATWFVKAADPFLGDVSVTTNLWSAIWPTSFLMSIVLPLAIALVAGLIMFANRWLSMIGNLIQSAFSTNWLFGLGLVSVGLCIASWLAINFLNYLAYVFGYIRLAWTWSWPILGLTVLMSMGLCYLGLSTWDYVNKYRTVEVPAGERRDRALKDLEAESERAHADRQHRRIALVQNTQQLLYRTIADVDMLLTNIRRDADRLSARLLLTQAPTELIDISGLESQLVELKHTYSRIASPAQ